MQRNVFTFVAAGAAIALVASCTSPQLIEQAPEPQSQPTAEQPSAAQETDQANAKEPPLEIEAPPVAGDARDPLPALKQGAIERYDCLSGTPDWHARIAFEAQAGQVLGFAYYSKWKPRTCSIHFMRNSAGSKWGMLQDGTVRVDTANGRILIRTHPDAYVFEFEHVQRRKFCGMPGEINGTMTVKRKTFKPQCSVAGIMDTNDPLLDSLYKSKK